MTLSIGNKAPDFNLFSSEKKETQLSAYAGKNLVILFFPLAFTGVCTAELCEMRDNFKKYESLNAEIVGISVDSLFVLERFKAELELNFTLLSDFNKEASRSYGALYENFGLGMREVSKRAAFIVGKKGLIKYAEVLEDVNSLPNFSAMQETLKKIQKTAKA